MPTITPTPNIDPTVMANNWATGVQNNAQKWLAKYLAPKKAFNADPNAAEIAWNNGIARANARKAYSKGLAGADLALAATNAASFGVSNYGSAGTNHKAKYAAKTVKLAQAMSDLRSRVNAMDGSTLEGRIAKSAAWARGMAALKGTF